MHDYEGNAKVNSCNKDISGFDFSEWHTITCLFESDKISILVDDKLVDVVNRILSVTGSPINCGDEISSGTYFLQKSFPIEKMYLVFDLALTSPTSPGGSVPIDETTPFPSNFEIDYIKKWKRKSEEIEINVKPNPTTTFSEITCNSQMLRMRLFNNKGQLIQSENVFKDIYNLNMTNLSSGLYFLQILLESGTKTVKVIRVLE